VKPVSEWLRLGFSAVAPLGGGVDYGRQFVGRYQATRSVLQGVGLSPSVGYKLTDRLSVGAGVSALYKVLDLKIAVNQSAIEAPDGQVYMDNSSSCPQVDTQAVHELIHDGLLNNNSRYFYILYSRKTVLT